MKKYSFIIVIILIIFFFVGCYNDSETWSESLSANSDKTESAILEDTIDCLYITEESSKNLISVQIPILTTNELEVNEFIKNQVYIELDRWLVLENCDLKESETPIVNIGEKMYNGNYNDYYLNVESHISFQNEHIVSIVFNGDYNQRTAVHPNDVFFTINIDLKSVKRIGFSDVYLINDAMYNTFLRYVNSDRIPQSELISLSVFEKVAFIEGLSLEPSTEFYSYFTPIGVGISYPVPFALGNHIEAEIPYTEINSAIKDN